jgi:hypothetical protein
MKLHELFGKSLVENLSNIDVSNLGIGELIDQAESTLPLEASNALDYFIGVTPKAKSRGEWGGIMQSQRLEDAYSSIPSKQGNVVKQQLTAAFEPIKAALRKKFGDVITLYRGQGSVDSASTPRHTLSWTSDQRVAAHFAGVEGWEMRLKPITDQDIDAALKQYHANGKIKWHGNTYVRTDITTDDPTLDKFYYEIFDKSGDMITDGDNIEQQFRDDQTDYQELIDKRNKKLSQIIKAKIPLDDIIWITDRAGQSEFILHNRPNSAGYIDKQGHKIN